MAGKVDHCEWFRQKRNGLVGDQCRNSGTVAVPHTSRVDETWIHHFCPPHAKAWIDSKSTPVLG